MESSNLEDQTCVATRLTTYHGLPYRKPPKNWELCVIPQILSTNRTLPLHTSHCWLCPKISIITCNKVPPSNGWFLCCLNCEAKVGLIPVLGLLHYHNINQYLCCLFLGKPSPIFSKNFFLAPRWRPPRPPGQETEWLSDRWSPSSCWSPLELYVRWLWDFVVELYIEST